MDRLTIKSLLSEKWILKTFEQEAIDRLAAYEDTGLTPEEIVALAGEVNIWKGGYYDLLKTVQQGMSMINGAIRKISGANKQESEG